MARDKTILYVEDDAVTLTAHTRRLEQVGFKVDTARDGVEALKCLYKSKPDLLLLDLMLPRLNGEDVLKFIYSDSRLSNIPIIILSTTHNLTAANEYLVEKAQKQILKDVCTFEKLVQSIDEVLATTDSVPANNPEPAINSKPVQEFTAKEIQDLQNQMQVVCAWTGRIKVDDQWMTISEFLSKRLHMTVTHGVSPEAMQKFLHDLKPPAPPPA